MTTTITEFPELEELNQRLAVGFDRAREAAKEEHPDRAEDIDDLVASNIVVVGDWANDRGDAGETPLDVIYFVDDGTGDPETIPQFSRIAGFMADILQDVTEPTTMMQNTFPIFQRRVLSISQFEDVLQGEIEQQLDDQGVPPREEDHGEVVYDLTTDTFYTSRPVEPFGFDLVEITPEDVEEIREEEEPPFPISPAEPPVPVIEPEPDEEVDQLEQLRQRFPDVPEELLPFAISEDELEIPAGKETRRVPARSPYPFEEEMYSPGDARTEIREFIQEGIGDAIATGEFGDTAPPSQFPDTSGYIKNYLRFQGPQYALQMYRDIVVYTGYIRRIHEGDFRAGEYNSFRTMLNRLALPEEEGGPHVIRKIPPQEAEQRGFDIVPNHPKHEGEKAPWLQPRQYYEIIEDKLDHPAWDNVTDWIYEGD